MCDSAQELEGVALFLQGVCLDIGYSVDGYTAGVNLGRLSLSWRGFHLAFHVHTGPTTSINSARPSGATRRRPLPCGNRWKNATRREPLNFIACFGAIWIMIWNPAKTPGWSSSWKMKIWHCAC